MIYFMMTAIRQTRYQSDISFLLHKLRNTNACNSNIPMFDQNLHIDVHMWQSMRADNLIRLYDRFEGFYLNPCNVYPTTLIMD